MVYLAESTLEKAVKQVKAGDKRNFLESVEVAFNLKDLDLSDPKNRLNEEIVLPSGRGKPVKVGVFGSEEMKQKAKAAADAIYGPEDLAKFAEDKKAFKKIANQMEFFIAEATLMATIGRTLGQVLGPRGKIPRPAPPGQDPTTLIGNLKKTVRARSRDRRTFHVPIGTREMKDQELIDNFNAVFKRLTGKLEKGRGNIESIYLKTTMGKAVKLEVGELE